MPKKNPWQTPAEKCLVCGEMAKLESNYACTYLGFIVHKKCAVVMKQRLAKLLEMKDG